MANPISGMRGFLADAADSAIPAIKAGVQGFNPAGIWDSAHNIGLGALSGVSPSQYGEHRDYVADLKTQRRVPGSSIGRDDYLRGSAQDLAQRSPLPSPVLNALGHVYQFGDEVSKSFRNKTYPNYSFMDAIEEAGRSADINKEGIYNRDLPLEFPEQRLRFDLKPDLNIPPLLPEGAFAPYQGPVEWDFTPSREDWFPERQDLSIIDISQPWDSPDELPLSNRDVFGEQIHYSEDLYGAVTPEQQAISEANIARLIEEAQVRKDEQAVEAANIIQEQMVPESESRRLDEIMTKAREDRIAQEKIAADARRAKEADETRARELREEAARAEDRQDKARLSREAEERDRQAKERAQEERNAAEAARLNSLAEAADKMAIDQARKQQEEQARKQAEFNKQHEAFVKQMDRDWRARQQASMPKSWAFF